LIKAGAFKIKTKVNNDFMNWGNIRGKLALENWMLLSQRINYGCKKVL